MKKSIICILCFVLLAAMILAPATYGYQSPEPTEEQLALVESQSIGLTGVTNARQLGGYVTEDGRKVKDGVLIRSGALGTATEEDIRILTEDYNVKLIIDFRNERDAGRSPDPEFNDAVIVTVPVWDENINAVTMADFMALMAEFGDQPGRSDLESIRRGYMGADPDLYIKQNFQAEISLAGFREFFDLLLAQEEGTGIIFHCSSGKDRTGSAAVLLLTVLGVDRETVIKDYALTNVILKDSLDQKVAESSQYDATDEELEAVFTTNGVNPSWMEHTFDYAEEQAGSMLEYIKQVYGITDEEIQTLRDKYLE